MPPKPKRRKTIGTFHAPNQIWDNGALVWAKFSQKWWSAVIIGGHNNKDKLPEGKYRIFWFGDHRTSEVTCNNIMNFQENYKPVVSSGFKRSTKTWRKGVAEALQELYQKKDTFTEEEVYILGNEGLPEVAARINQDKFEMLGELQNGKEIHDVEIKKWIRHCSNNCVPDWIIRILSNQERELENDVAEEHEIKGSCSSEMKELINIQIEKNQPTQNICLACYSTTDVEFEHPLFQGNICKICQERISDTIYVKGDDGICYYCAICGFPGEMITCEDSCCGRVYCRVCISDLAAPTAWSAYLVDDYWTCFLCRDKVELNGVIFCQVNYLERIPQLFNSDGPRLVPVPGKLSVGKKLRVLSLFDGISTGFQVLDNLDVPVEKYYSCEIDMDAINISKVNFGYRIIQLGDISNLDEHRIQEISPINLLLGGSPCNELSLANPCRKGLYDLSGSGQLFFEFYRVLCLLRKYNPDGFFWIFENVASMPLRFKATISRFLNSQPALLDASWFSPQCRPRWFWGNIPCLHQCIQIVPTTLQDYLLPGRTAVTNKIRTVTTRTNSLKQGTELYCPVTDFNGKPDVLWITELEKIFGFPLHYTDTGHLSVIQRQQALGKAWSVQTMTLLLRFLKEYY